MDNRLSSHTQFAALPVQARVLFFIYASATLIRFGTPSPSPVDLAPQLEAVWNRLRLRHEDLRDPDRITALLKKELNSSIHDATQVPTRCPDQNVAQFFITLVRSCRTIPSFEFCYDLPGKRTSYLQSVRHLLN